MTDEEKAHLAKVLSRINTLEATYRNAYEELQRCREPLIIAQNELDKLLEILPTERLEDPHNY